MSSRQVDSSTPGREEGTRESVLMETGRHIRHIESTVDQSLSETQSTTAGHLTPSSSGSEPFDEGDYIETHTSPPSFNLEDTSDCLNEALGELTLAADRSTPVSPEISDRNSDPADAQERPTSVSSVLEGLRLLGFDEDQLDNDDTDNDNTDDEEDSDSLSMYSVQQEPLPQAPIYDNDLQKALKMVRGHLSSIEKDMEQSSLIKDHGSDFFQQYEQVRMLNRLHCPETRTVGFIGNSGVGKSRLINSLLGLEGLAHSVCWFILETEWHTADYSRVPMAQPAPLW